MQNYYPTRIGFTIHRCRKENVCTTQRSKQYYSSRNLILTVPEFSSKG